MENNMKQAVKYCRVSTQKQGVSGLGLEAQDYIMDNVLGKDYEFVKTFTDIASGKSINKRTELQKAIKVCLDNGYTLIVAKCDRLARNTKDALEILERLENRFVSCDCPNTDKFSLTLLFAFAERERELISIRTIAALKSKKIRKAKELKSNFDSMSDEDQQLILDKTIINGNSKGCNTSKARKSSARIREQKAKDNSKKYIDTATALKDSGKSLRDIAKVLNKISVSIKDNRKFYASSVSRLLKRDIK